MSMSNRVQVLFTNQTQEGTADVDSFSIRQARTSMSGHIYSDNLTYKVQLDWAGGGNNNLLDAWFNWGDVWNGIDLRIGQQKPHHGKEFQGTSANLEHTTRSLASRTFSGNRVIGAYLHGGLMETVTWWAGAANNDAANNTYDESLAAGNGDNELNYFVNVQVDPFGDSGDEGYVQADLGHSQNAVGSIGASVMFGNHRTGGSDIETTSLNVYTNWHYRGLSVLAEMFQRSDENVGGADNDTDGLAIGAGYAMQPAEEGGTQWGFALRYSTVADDGNGVFSTPAGDQNELSATITNYYHGNNMKSQLSYRNTEDDAGVAEDAHTIDILFQWKF